MKSALDILFLRRPSLRYVSPGVCEASFSGSSFPVIILDALANLLGPTGLTLGGVGGFLLSWNNYPGALCFSVYKAVDELDPFGAYVLIAECINDNFIDLESFGPGTYRVTAITPEGESPPSEPIVVTGGGGGSVDLIVDSLPVPAIPIGCKPADGIGNTDGTTSFMRTYPFGRIVTLVAPITHLIDIEPFGDPIVQSSMHFQKWQKDGVDYSFFRTTQVLLNEAVTTMTAVYGCDNSGNELPATFVLSSPTSLGRFSVPTTGVPTVISSDTTASNYSVIYKGGTIKGGISAPTCVDSYTLPPGFLVVYDNGVTNQNLSVSPAGVSCASAQPTIQNLVPLDKTVTFLHTGGTFHIVWSGVLQYFCGDCCPEWDVVQESGRITAPGAVRIRDFDALKVLMMPQDLLNAGADFCEGLDEVSYQLETDPGQVEWDGSHLAGPSHNHSYTNTDYLDELPVFQDGGGNRIALNGFSVDYAQVKGPITLAAILAEFPVVPDPIPPSAVDRYWVYVIWGLSHAVHPIWVGVKTVGDTCIGSYQRIDSPCRARSPYCIYIESAE